MNNEMNELFSNAPQEMKDATTRMHHARKRLTRAQTQLDAWREEKNAAESGFYAEEKLYGAVSMRWNIETNKMEPPLEEIVK